MTKIKYTLFTIVVTLLFINCNNDDDNTPQRADGRTEVEIDERSDTYGVWRIESIVSSEPEDLNKDGISNTNLMLELPACFVDNMYDIRANGSYYIIDAGLICEGNERGQELDKGIHDSFSIDPRDNSAQFFFEPQQPSVLSSFRWVIMHRLEDSNTPNKRYLELFFPTSLREDLVGIDTLFGNGNVRIIMMAAK